jgi:hypothetical protein
MNRRKILGMLGAAPLASSLAFPRLAKADGHLLNPNDSDDLYTIHRKLNYSSDNRVVYWYLRAIRYGLVDSAFTPFWDMHVGFISITEDDGDGFKSSTMSSIFYTDLETGKQIENFDNPYTGERLSVRQPGLGRSSRHYNKVGMENERPDRPGMNITQFGDVGPAWVVGDDVWVRGDTGFRGEPTTDEGSLIQINDWSTYHGSIAEVSDASVASANATQAFNDINTWPGWLNMGDRPGNYVSRGFGRKSWSMDGMPPEWSAVMKDQYPKEFSDPRGYIEGA